MSKKALIWTLGVMLLVVFVSLLGLQYIYYSRILSLHKEQTTSLAKLALQEVTRDVEVKELVRYLNLELNTSSEPNSRLMEALQEIRSSSRQADTPFKRIMIRNPRFARDADSLFLQSYFDTLAVSDKVISAFVDDKSRLDEYILRNLYRVYSYDSVPQLVSPKFLREHITRVFQERGISVPFSFSLCNPQGGELFRYRSPKAHISEPHEDDIVIQRLFVNREYPNKLTPFIRLTLDFTDLHSDMKSLTLPGLIITLFIIVFGIVALGFVSRQMSFQEMKTDFINNMTHELKTPVSSILLSVEQMQRMPVCKDLSPEYLAQHRRYLTIMEDESQRLRMLIDKVLQIALYDQNKRENLVRLNEMSVDEIIFKAAKLFSVHAGKYQGSLLLEHDAENTWIMGNETHMTNVLYNLLENAIKYRSEDRSPIVVLKTYNNPEGELVICVEDNGLGIPESETKKIFERFYRVPMGFTHNVKGHGLGLAYVHSIVKQFGGRISASNKASGGLKMMIVLPTLGEEKI